MPISTDAFRTELRSQLQAAAVRGADHVDISAGELHRKLGGYPGPIRQMPSCCQAMYAEQGPGDEILSSPPKGKGASLTIRYRLPRSAGFDGMAASSTDGTLAIIPYTATMPDADAQPDTHFGFSTVPLGDKQAMVDEVFHKVAGRYDLMNDLMSAGLHRLWKDALVTAVNPPRKAPFRHLDVAGGTGDVAFRILEGGGPQTRVTVLDINGSMLGVGRERAEAKGFGDRLDFVEANAEDLPLEDNGFDAYTVAFGIRNVPRIDRALAEAFRVLKRGGRFLCLEFSAVDLPGLDRLYDLYSLNVIPPLGRMVTGDARPYRYLVESIRKFPVPGAFSAMIAAAGFSRVTHHPLTGNVAAIHSGWKL